MTNKTQIDLYREYVRVSDMCDVYNTKHLCNIKPWECVRYHDEDVTQEFYSHPKLDSKNKDAYKFAVAILEGRSVFVGDILFSTIDGEKYTCTDKMPQAWIDSFMTWTPPTKKRTFTLNGVELPCPSKDRAKVLVRWGNKDFYFKSDDEYSEWNRFFGSLLTAARDKE